MLRARPCAAASASRSCACRRSASGTCRRCACRSPGARREDERQGDERSAVLRPAGLDRQEVEARRRSSLDHLLARPVFTAAAPALADPRELRQPPAACPPATSACSSRDQLRDVARAMLFQLVDPQRRRSCAAREPKALISSGIASPAAFSNSSAGPPALHHPVRDLRDLQIGSAGYEIRFSSPIASIF